MVRTNNITSTSLKLVAFIVLGCLATVLFLNIPRNRPLQTAEEMQPHKVGGLGAVRENDEEVGKIIDEIKPKFEAETGKKYKSIEVLSYKTQVVAGINYFVKAKVIDTDDKEQIVHLRIYKGFRQTELELTAYRLDRSLDEEIMHFQ